MPRQSTPQTPQRGFAPYSRQPRSAKTNLKIPPKLEFGSDFTPSPSPSTDDSRSSVFTPKDEHIEDDDDIRPYQSEEEEEDVKPTTKTKTTKKTASPAKNKTRGKVGAWTGQEDWMLFKMMHPKTSPNWASIAEAVGRDSKVSTMSAEAWVGVFVLIAVMSKPLRDHE